MKKLLAKIIFIDNIWGDKVSANQWLLPLSILTAALSGVILGGSMTFKSADSSMQIAMCYSLIMLWGYNLAESIIASKTPLVALGRSALTLVLIAATFVVSYVAAVVVLIIIILILLAVVLLFSVSIALKTNLFSDISSGGSSGGYDAQTVDSDGGVVNLKDYGTILKGDNGKSYRRTTGGIEEI